MFLELADSHGTTQVVSTRKERKRELLSVNLGSLVTVTGCVKLRGPGNANLGQVTGAVEVELQAFRVWEKQCSTSESQNLLSTLTEQRQGPSIQSVVGSARRIMEDLGFVETPTVERIWAGVPLKAGLDALFRIVWPIRSEDQRIDPANLLLELKSVFVTQADLQNTAELLLAGLAQRLDGSERRLPQFGHQEWTTCARDQEPTGLLWSEGPTLLSPSYAPFPHDPCQNLLALPRLELSEWSPYDPLSAQVYSFALLADGVCVATGTIWNHDVRFLAELCEELRALGPTICARARAQLSAFRQGLPPNGSLTLDLLAFMRYLGGRSQATPKLHFAESTQSCMRTFGLSLQNTNVSPWCVLESDLLTTALEGMRVSSKELRRMASRAERRDTESAAAVLASLEGFSTTPANGSPATNVCNPLARLMTGPIISLDQCEGLLDLFPSQKECVLAQPPDDLFQWLWSILGHDFVREFLSRSDSYKLVQKAIALGVVTDYRHLVYLDAAALADLEKCQQRYCESVRSDSRISIINLVKVLRRILAEQPASFATLVTAIATAAEPDIQISEAIRQSDRQEHLMLSAKGGLCAPLLLPLFLKACGDHSLLTDLKATLDRQAIKIYPNRPIEASGVAYETAEELSRLGFSDSDILPLRKSPEMFLSNLIFYLYRPVNMSVRTIASILGMVSDCTSHLETAGLEPGGPNWDHELECYVFRLKSFGNSAMRLFLSKNVASFFSKSSVGLCTARDIDLYTRPDHFHLNVIGPDSAFTVGNVQLHVLQDRGRRVLLVRAINVSATWVSTESAHDIVNATLVASLELAIQSKFDALYVGEGLDLWHLNSARCEIRAVLDDYQDRLERVVLERPLFLFRFANMDRTLLRAYRIWPLPPELARIVGINDFVSLGQEINS